ncbi:hypothetical protein RD792_009107 [Penstemon davidsonii]|uniref:Origin recognition complex subunit 1 n=1 Tax=Penstemon davidsonii TaxID=160366 RepID=A0ABR0DB32_9LAMI|nr:hypothetical protein RD792_009107 [Penstemon davidsonii]
MAETPKSKQNPPPPVTSPANNLIAAFIPQTSTTRPKRKLQHKQTPRPQKRRIFTTDIKNSNNKVKKKRVYYKKLVYNGFEFAEGDDVYAKRNEDTSSDGDGDGDDKEKVILEKNSLNCLKPPLKKVPEGDWICNYCHGRKLGKLVEFPEPPNGKKRVRTAREKLLCSDLRAARIERYRAQYLWREVDGTYWCRFRWYIIPEETIAGRQPHNLRRELYRTNDFADVEMESIIRHCYVMSPKEFSKASNEGDDVFLCEYEYNIHYHSFKRISEIDNNEDDVEGAEIDVDWNSCNESDYDTEEEIEYKDKNKIGSLSKPSPSHPLAATDLEKAKSALLLSTFPKSPPCRNKEMDEITTFIKSAICDEQCLGRCLFICGVPGTGKTMSVLSVMRNLKSEVDKGSIRPYCFVKINGLKLVSPDNIYSVIYEGLSGHRVGWKKASRFLNERFSDESKRGEEDTKPCILLIDELDQLVTRNQSVLYNILDWPTKPNSKLIVIGISNTMNLPENLRACICSRMGIQRLCFHAYNYQQLEEIISSRLKGIHAFEKLAIEFASRKEAAVTGDARRALEICRRAAELADFRAKSSPLSSPDSVGKVIIGMADVEAAANEVFEAPHIQMQAWRMQNIIVRGWFKAQIAEIATQLFQPYWCDQTVAGGRSRSGRTGKVAKVRDEISPPPPPPLWWRPERRRHFDAVLVANRTRQSSVSVLVATRTK